MAMKLVFFLVAHSNALHMTKVQYELAANQAPENAAPAAPPPEPAAAPPVQGQIPEQKQSLNDVFQSMVNPNQWQNQMPANWDPNHNANKNDASAPPASGFNPMGAVSGMFKPAPSGDAQAAPASEASQAPAAGAAPAAGTNPFAMPFAAQPMAAAPPMVPMGGFPGAPAAAAQPAPMPQMTFSMPAPPPPPKVDTWVAPTHQINEQISNAWHNQQAEQRKQYWDTWHQQVAENKQDIKSLGMGIFGAIKR